MATGGYEILTQKPAKIKLRSTRISKLSSFSTLDSQKVRNFEQFSNASFFFVKSVWPQFNRDSFLLPWVSYNLKCDDDDETCRQSVSLSIEK